MNARALTMLDAEAGQLPRGAARRQAWAWRRNPVGILLALACLAWPNPCPAVVVAEVGLERSAALAAESTYAAVGWVGIQEGAANYRGTGVLIDSE
jgi:hypothetical protein